MPMTHPWSPPAIRIQRLICALAAICTFTPDSCRYQAISYPNPNGALQPGLLRRQTARGLPTRLLGCPFPSGRNLPGQLASWSTCRVAILAPMLSPRSRPRRVLLRLAFYRPANREQEDGALSLRVWGKEGSYIIIEEGQPCGTQALGICSQVHPAADGSRLHLDCPVPAVPISLQNALQIGEKEDVNAGVPGKLLLQSKIACLSAEFSFLQKLQRVPLTAEVVSARIEPLHRVCDQVKIVEP